jgi:hypothetical protein
MNGSFRGVFQPKLNLIIDTSIHCELCLHVEVYDIDIFVNCYWVDTRWQYYSTHLHTNNTQNKTITLVGRFYGIRMQNGKTKFNDE